MSKKILVSIPDTHVRWMESVRIKKGVEVIQDVMRDIITKAYEHSKVKDTEVKEHG